jgi:ribose transport system permease protein
MRQFFTAYGMLTVLLLLCVFFSGATTHQEVPTGQEGGETLAAQILARSSHSSGVVIVTQTAGNNADFAAALQARLREAQVPVLDTITGDPPQARQALAALAQAGKAPTLVATTPECRDWAVWNALRTQFPAYANVEVLAPPPRRRSTFLSSSNLRNIADQIAVIAILAVGMTMVIITGGIDLSVGSLIALAAVVTAWSIRAVGGVNASSGAMLGACLAAIAVCGAVGVFSGLMITRFRIPPFIATLAMMQVASGLAFMITQGQSIYDISPRFTWLGRGTDLLSIPNAVVLMLVIYVLAHFLMARTRLGRHIYAVGGNAEASRLSGVSIGRTLMCVYLVSGLMAGVGGVITVSQLKAGAPTYGVMYELYVIAAVVVGGTSLSGGEGTIFGTLIGAFIIAVIRNGMNLMNVEPYTQKVVLGLVILGAVLIDRLKRKR